MVRNFIENISLDLFSGQRQQESICGALLGDEEAPVHYISSTVQCYIDSVGDKALNLWLCEGRPTPNWTRNCLVRSWAFASCRITVPQCGPATRRDGSSPPTFIWAAQSVLWLGCHSCCFFARQLRDPLQQYSEDSWRIMKSFFYEEKA